jgi:hypothetical protein
MSKQIYTLELLNNCAERDEATILEYYDKNMETISPDNLSYYSIIRYKCKCGKIDCKQFRYIWSSSGKSAGILCKECTENNRKLKRKSTLSINCTSKNISKRKVLKNKIKIVDKEEQDLRKWRDDLELKRNPVIMDNEWYTHPEYTKYEANTNGEVRNKDNIQILNGTTNKKGRTTFNIDGKKQKHRFIMECLYNIIIPRGYDIDHIDRNPGNNVYTNLKILTKKEHGQKTSDDNPSKGVNSRRHFSKDIKCIFPNGTEQVFQSLSEAKSMLRISNEQIYSSIENDTEDYRGNKWSWVVNEENDIEGEEWIESYIKKDLYVSNKGRVWFKYSHKQRKTYGTLASESEYYTIGIIIDKKNRHFQVHQLIIHAFIGPPPSSLHTVDHLDRNPKNNCIENLRWATPQEQCINSSNVKKIEIYDTETFEVIKIFDSVKECAEEYNISSSLVIHYLSFKNGNYYINNKETNRKISVRYSDVSIQEKQERELNVLEYQLNLARAGRKKRNSESNTENLPLHISKNRDKYVLKVSFRGETFIKYNKDLQCLATVKEKWLEEKYKQHIERINSLIE